jgi:hypothetical protein
MADLRQRFRPPPARNPVYLPRDVNRAANAVVWLAEPLQGGLGRLFFELCTTLPGFIIMSLVFLFFAYGVLMFQREFTAPEPFQTGLLWAARLVAAILAVPFSLVVAWLEGYAVEIVMPYLMPYLEPLFRPLFEPLFLYVYKRLLNRLASRLEPALREEYRAEIQYGASLGGDEAWDYKSLQEMYPGYKSAVDARMEGADAV